MKNDQRDLDNIRSWVTKLATCGKPDTLPEHLVEYLDEVYALIPKDHLPDITFGSLDDEFGEEGRARTKDLSELAFGGDTKAMRDIALQYLALAAYLEERTIEKQTKETAVRRYKVFRELFPETSVLFEGFKWDLLTAFEQMVIDKMVLLKMEVDKNF